MYIKKAWCGWGLCLEKEKKKKFFYLGGGGGKSYKVLNFSAIQEIPLFILTIVQRDATQSSLFIILQDHSTCFSHVGGR